MVFIVGNPRSGTTWLKEVLGGHLDFTEFHEVSNYFCLSLERETDFIKPSHETYKKLLLQIYQNIIRTATSSIPQTYKCPVIPRSSNRILIKEVEAMKNLPFSILDVLEDLSKTQNFKVIFIVRHPLSTTASAIKNGWDAADGTRLNLTDFDLFQRRFEVQASNIIRYLRYPISLTNHCYLIFYENLILKPEVEFKRLFDFLGYKEVSVNLDLVRQHSETTTAYSLIRNKYDSLTGWQQTFFMEALASRANEFLVWSEILLQQLGIENLYNKAFMPNKFVTSMGRLKRLVKLNLGANYDSIVGSILPTNGLFRCNQV